MSDLQKKQAIDAINELLKRTCDDYEVLKDYGVKEHVILGRVIEELEAVQEKLMDILEVENGHRDLTLKRQD